VVEDHPGAHYALRRIDGPHALPAARSDEAPSHALPSFIFGKSLGGISISGDAGRGNVTQSRLLRAHPPLEKNIGQIFWGIHSLFEIIRRSLIPANSLTYYIIFRLIVTSRGGQRPPNGRI
jgi:hypothetical protein